MRALTKKQKQILDEWYEKNKNEIQVGILSFDVDDCPLFGYDLFKQLEAINEYETITWDINRYISDKAMGAKHG